MLLKFFRNIIIVIALTCLGYSPVLYFNVYQDPYSIFTSDFTNRRIEPNSHFIKMRYICNNPKLYDSFIFGNSRANNINPKTFTNGKYFNLYYSLGVPKEYLDDIKLLLANGIEMKNILVCLDYSSYSTSAHNRANDMLRIPYPGNKNKLLKTYIKYTFPIPDEKFKEEYYNSAVTPIYAKMFETGQAENKEVEYYIEHNKQEHVNNPKFNTPFVGYEYVMDEALGQIDSIKKICDGNNIKLSIAMNPIHKTTYLGNNLDNYFFFLKRLSEISDFYDFSGINRVTSNNYFYYEPSHFRPLIGDAMANFIQYKKRIDTIPEFGTYVTRQTIEAHINQLKNTK